MRLRGVHLAAVVALAAIACAPPSAPGEAQATRARRRSDAACAARAEVALSAGARVVPIEVAESRNLGVEPGCGTRSILAGVRVVALLGGAILTAEERLPGTKWEVVPLPDRLGGGVSLARWTTGPSGARKNGLGQRPICSANAPITRISARPRPRIYVLTGSWHAFDGATGEAKPLGPWPASPTVGAYAAADGWRGSCAVADLQGCGDDEATPARRGRSLCFLHRSSGGCGESRWRWKRPGARCAAAAPA